MNNFWSMDGFWYGMLELARNAAIVGGVALFVFICWWGVVHTQKFWTSSPPKWFNDWWDGWFYGRKK